MGDFQYNSFREKLNKVHEWPSIYMFKFIVPSDREKEVVKLFPKNILEKKPSKNGKYVSLTARVMMASPDHIITIYEKANTIEGIIAL